QPLQLVDVLDERALKGKDSDSGHRWSFHGGDEGPLPLTPSPELKGGGQNRRTTQRLSGSPSLGFGRGTHIVGRGLGRGPSRLAAPYQPRVASSSASGKVEVEIPRMGLPMPRLTSARTA